MDNIQLPHPVSTTLRMVIAAKTGQSKKERRGAGKIRSGKNKSYQWKDL
jgi:hypothetical protein